MRQPGGERLNPLRLHERIPSRRFGTYSLLSKLGEGGMAVVYLAEAVNEQHEVFRCAIKFAKPVEIEQVDLSELFAVEGDVMGLLRHPNLVELYEVGKHNESWFLAMEYCPGGDLGALTNAVKEAGRPFPASIALQIGIDLLRGLAYVHQAQGVRGTSLGLVHGDINPQNIFLDTRNDRAKLGDFGVVTSMTLGTGMPEGFLAGKLHYLSPEQAQGKPMGPTSDLWAVAVVLFEMLLGARPFNGDDADAVMNKIIGSKPELPKGASGELVDILLKALQRNPKNRYPSAGAFAGELLRYQLDAGLQLAPGVFSEFTGDLLGLVF